MSEMSEKARAAAKDKAERMARSDPHARVDASGYAPEGALDGDVQTGPRVLSRRQFRRGGKVEGMAAPPRADRKRRASGGPLTADSLINRNVKEANQEREGTKHVGGFAKGGRAEAMKERVHKLIGGALTPQQKLGMMRRPAAAAPGMTRPVMRAEGGKVHKDEAQDRKLIHEMGCKCGKCGGGRVQRKEGGKLTAEARKHIKAKNFAGPDRSYPIEDASHARNALARVSQHGSPEVKKEVRAKVHAKYPDIGKKAGGSVGAINDGTRPTGGRLARKGGGRAKKGTNVNIIIAPQGAAASTPPMPARPMPPPQAMPVGLHQGAPPVMPPAGVAPQVPQGIPMRARGGRTHDGMLAKPGTYPIESGAGGGLGRLEKAQRAVRS